ncbi:MAG: 5'-nucleotidase C-terminal domain-containing protein [Spirochaetes bacterium]|nr:5'-nucleotidase C-terminal domain-containing protein [Spirochaetota bacterium]
MKFLKKLFLFSAAVLISASLLTAFQAAAQTNNSFTLKVLHTNDTHLRLMEGTYDGMGFPKLAAKINELRKGKDPVLLLDAGDFVHGMPIGTISKGEKIIGLLDLMGYDAITIGNHEFDYGKNQLLKLIKKTKVPFISANIYSGKKRFSKPYIIKEIQGVKVGIFGLTTPESYVKAHPKNVTGLTIKDPADEARIMVSELQSKGCSVIIALVHLGIDESTPENWRSTYVAENVPGIDLIVDGHSHSSLPSGMKSGSTMIVSAMEYDKALGIVDLDVSQGKVSSVKASYFTKEDAAKAPEDSAVLAFIKNVENQNKKITDAVIGKSDIELNGEKNNVRAGETNLGNLITNSILWKTGADCVITNGGGIRASVAKGKITKGNIITVLPFGNTIVVKEISGKDIREALEFGVADYPNTAGKFPHVAGITFKLDAKAAAGKRVVDLMIGGKPADDKKLYKLATNDFMAAGGDGYAMFKPAKEYKLYGGLDEILIEYIDSNGTVTEKIAKVDGRITVINK